MAGKTILYEWLEGWEHALGGPAPADLDEFIQQNCGDGEPGLVAEFRRRAGVLRSINADLRAFGAPADTGPDSPGSTDARPGARPALQPGQEVVPGYPLERFLGRGGFGEVWQARSPSGGSVALKFVRLGDRLAQVEQRSLDIMREVRHPHLLPVLGSWGAGGYLVIAMELADRTLDDRFREAAAGGRPGIPPEESLRLFEQAADALDYLNRPRREPGGQTQQGIQHRDIKPQNLLLVGDTLKIGDFGLARCLENSVTSHTGSHTPAYAAPEFFDGKATSQSDQYSLAVTWCALRGGRLPFQGSGAQVMAGHLHNDPHLTALPAGERYPVLRALSKHPKGRWPSCKEFVAALRVDFDVNRLRALLRADPMNAPLRRLYLSLRSPQLKEEDRLSSRLPFRLRWNEWLGGPLLLGLLIYLTLYRPDGVSGTAYPWLWGGLLAFMVVVVGVRLQEAWRVRRKLRIALAEVGPLGRMPVANLYLTLDELRRKYLEGQGTAPPEP